MEPTALPDTHSDDMTRDEGLRSTREAGNSDEPALRYYWTLISRHKYIVLVCLLAPLIYAAYKVKTTDKLYEANAKVVLNRESVASAVTGISDPGANSNDPLRLVETEAGVARSSDITSAAARSVPNAGVTGSQLRDNSSVSASRDADFLNFYAQNGSPDIAAALTNAYAKAYVDVEETSQRQRIQSVRTALTRSIARLNPKSAEDRRVLGQLRDQQDKLRSLELLQTPNAAVVVKADGGYKIEPKAKTKLLLGLIEGLVLAALAVWLISAIRSARRPRQAAGPE